MRCTMGGYARGKRVRVVQVSVRAASDVSRREGVRRVVVGRGGCAKESDRELSKTWYIRVT